MSYILDAIKKAERQRRKDSVPTLESIVSYQENVPDRPQFGRMLLIGIVVLLLAFAGWFHKPIVREISEAAAFVGSWAGNIFSRSYREVEEQSTVQSNQSSGGQPAIQAETVASQQQGQTQTETQSQQSALELTLAQRKAVESIQLAVISYSSDSNKRFIMDGTQVLREGDFIKGFLITAIEKDSIVLDVDGQDFQIKF